MARKQHRRHPPAPDPRLAALASPLRLEIIAAVKAAGSCAVRELATRMGRPADGLYHHVRTLLRAGILEEIAQRKVGKRIEAVYALRSPRVEGALDPASPASRDLVTRAATAALRLAAREFRDAVAAGAITCTDAGPNAL